MVLKKIIIGLIMFLMCLNIVFSIDISFIEGYGIDSDNNRLQLNSSTLEEVERLIVNYQISSADGIDSWYLNYTMGGTDACALGNKQDKNCYNYLNDNLSQVWIQFINGSETSTFDGTSSVQGDNIIPTLTQINASLWNLSLSIDEHYQNVLKHYDALFNFSDVNWQTDLKITNDNFLEINIIESGIISPFTKLPDAFKVDIRVNYTKGSLIPTQPLEIYTCYNYTTGNPELISNCEILCAKSPIDFQDDGTKVRCTGAGSSLENLEGIPQNIVLKTDESNPAKYYYIKSYKIRDLSHDSTIMYSTDSGTSYTTNTDGYESDANVNWFNDGINSTKLVLNLFANSTSSSTSSLSFINWSIDPSTLYSPLITILFPEDNSIISSLDNITLTWSALDVNGDNLNISIYLDNNLLISDLNQSNTSYSFNPLTVGSHDIKVTAIKILDTSFSAMDTHTFLIPSSSSGGGGIQESITEDEIIEVIGKGLSTKRDIPITITDITLIMLISSIVLFGIIGKYIIYTDMRYTIRIGKFKKIVAIVVLIEAIVFLVAYAIL